MISVIEFKTIVEKIGDDDDAQLQWFCINYLKIATHDHGREGQLANKLLKLVGEILDN